MNSNISLYLHLRLKQVVRILAGIGPIRCLFLFGIATILFYASTKITRAWFLPTCHLLVLWLYHNNRNDKAFLALHIRQIKRLFTAEYLLLSLPFLLSGVIASNYIAMPIILLTTVIIPRIRSVKYHSFVLPLPPFHRGDILYRRMYRKYFLLYIVLFFFSFMGALHHNINLCKVSMLLWGVVQGTAYMVIPSKYELAVYDRFNAYLLVMVKSNLWNVFLTLAPFVVLLFVLAHDIETLFFCLALFSSTMLYLLNIGMARFTFETQMAISIYWLLCPLALFLVSVMIPIILIPFGVINIGVTIWVKKKYKHIWN